MRVSRPVLSALSKFKNPVAGNVVNPRATDPLLPSDFRSPAPASQVDYHNDKTFPSKSHDIDTIAYAPHASRTYKEPQQLVVHVKSNGELTVEAVEREGSVDAPFMPLAAAGESEVALKMDVLAELQATWEENNWLKPEVALPELGNPNYVFEEVGSSEWDRKD